MILMAERAGRHHHLDRAYKVFSTSTTERSQVDIEGAPSGGSQDRAYGSNSLSPMRALDWFLIRCLASATVASFAVRFSPGGFFLVFRTSQARKRVRYCDSLDAGH